MDDVLEGEVPKAVTCLKDDLEDLLTCFQFDDHDFRKAIRTTNAIERRFREVRRRTRPMGVFSNRTSVERIPMPSSCTRILTWGCTRSLS